MILVIAVIGLSVAYALIGAWLWERSEHRWQSTPDAKRLTKQMQDALYWRNHEHN